MSSFSLASGTNSLMGAPKAEATLQDAPKKQTLQPIVTGTTVIGLKYNGGVMLAADTLASYGSLARYKDVRRLDTVGENTIIGASGEMSDYQAIIKKLQHMDNDDINQVHTLLPSSIFLFVIFLFHFAYCVVEPITNYSNLPCHTLKHQDDGYRRSPAEVFNYLRAIMYERRNKGNPLWNSLLIAGHKNGASFLGHVDLIGTAYEENFIATGFGAYLAIPLIREKWSADMDEGEARALLEDCMRVMFYRDCRASNRVQIAKASDDGTIVSEPYELSHDWETANYDARHAISSDGSSW